MPLFWISSSILWLLAGCQSFTPPIEPTPSKAVIFEATAWENLPFDWKNDPLLEAWPAFLASCKILKNRAIWQSACQQAAQLQPSQTTIQQYLRDYFIPLAVQTPEGKQEGLITGYYEPILLGSRTPTDAYRYPLYAAPEDLLTIDLGEQYPQLKGLRLRGRLAGKKIVPYWSRSELESLTNNPSLRPLLWVADPIELFFLQIQGSGRVQLEDGSVVRVGYADQNGHPYRSIGKVLVDRGELTAENASMQGIQGWARQNPQQLTALLQQNPSFVFFRELPAPIQPTEGAPGALGIPLTPERSVAVDPRYIPLGAPIFLATTDPRTQEPLQKLMLAQDTGGAIRGAVRADYYWGIGPKAGAAAGKMRQMGKIWLLWPKEADLPKVDPSLVAAYRT